MLPNLSNFSRKDLAILIAGLIGVGLFLGGHKHSEGAGIKPVEARDCSTHTKTAIVKINIDEAGFQPKDSTAQLCDTLIITNTGTRPHQPAVGPHPFHTSYPGLEAKSPLKPGGEFRFLLNRPGHYPLHDHLNEEITATITINE